MNITPGMRLRTLRESVDKTIEQVAGENDISYSALQAYETDERMPRHETQRKLAKYYNTTVGFLFFGEQ